MKCAKNKFINICLILLLVLLFTTQATGKLPLHINPANVTASDTNLYYSQLMTLNELMSHWSGIFISLNKGDLDAAQKNFKDYLGLLQDKNNILITIEGDAYSELIESGNTLNLTVEQIAEFRSLYEAVNVAHQNNDSSKAIQLGLETRRILRNLDQSQIKFIMEAVEQFPGLDIAEYQNRSVEYTKFLQNLDRIWQPVESVIFDGSAISLTTSPQKAEYGDEIYIEGVLKVAKNGTGIPYTNIIIEIYGKPITSVTTDKSGHYNYSHTVTYKKPGSYPINVKFIPFSEPLLSSYASSSFDLVPTNTSLTIYAKPAEGIFGNTIHISGSLISKNNYRIPDAGISISLGNLTIGSVRTDANGTYAYDLLVQDLAEGVHILQANFNPDEQPLIKSSATTSIRLMPTHTSLTIYTNPNSVEFNDAIQISGRLFAENHLLLTGAKIDLLLDNQSIAIINTDDLGAYQYNLTVPAIPAGTHIIQARYIADDALLLPSGNSTQITVMPTDTHLNISASEEVHQGDYLDISWNVTTDKGFGIENPNITVLFDDEIIGNAQINNGNFHIVHWIGNSTPSGRHNITVKYNGNSPFLPSNSSMPIEILKPESNYGLYIIGILSIVILFALYLNRKSINSRIASIIASRNLSREGRKTPDTLPEQRIEEIVGGAETKARNEPEVRIEGHDDKLKTAFLDIDALITQKEYSKSISLIYTTIRNKMSDILGIDNVQCLTHMEFYNSAKDQIPGIDAELKEIIKLYEQAMYSGIEANEEHAKRCAELAKQISPKLSNTNQNHEK